MLLFTFLLFIAYVVTCVIMFKAPTSLSNTYYLLNEKRKGLGLAFTFMMWLLCFSIVIPMIEITNENFEFLPFLTVLGIGFVGAAPLFKRKGKGSIEPYVHFTGATLSAVGSLIWIFVCFPSYWTFLLANLFLMLIIMLVTRTEKSYMFYAEMVLLLSIPEIILMIF